MEDFQFNDADEIPQDESEFIDLSDEMPLNNGKQKKKGMWLTIAALVLFLLAAMLVGSRLLGFTFDDSGKAEVVNLGNGNTMTTYSGPEIEYDERYPKTNPDISGVFTRREDNSLFIGTGRVSFMASVKGSGEVNLDASFDGPVYEIIVTGETKIYIDRTYDEGIDVDEYEKIDKLDQVLEETDSLDGIIENTSLKVWGRRSGDRITADTLIYMPPPTLSIKR